MQTTTESKKIRLPVIGARPPEPMQETELDIDGELERFEREQREVLGLSGPMAHWRDDNPQKFTANQRQHTTILVGGLTMAHDFLITGALSGLGYKVAALDVPNS